MFSVDPTPGPAARPRSPSQRESWRACATPEGLALLEAREVNLVSWQRTLPTGLDASLAAWAQDFHATFDKVVAVRGFDLAAATQGMDEQTRPWIAEDIAFLLACLSHIAGAASLRVSFGAVRSDQCRKFHMDHVRYRLMTTYTGPGTEWVPEDAVSREALAHPANCPCDANKEIVRDAAAVRRAAAGDVLVMKGSRHEHGRGAVHRSPPIEGTNRVRVVLIASTVE